MEYESWGFRLQVQAQNSRDRRMFERQRAVAKRLDIVAFRNCFLGADGEPTADGMRVLANIASIAQLGTFDPEGVTDAEMRERNGARKLALHITSQLDLDGSRLRNLGRKLRESGNE